MKCTKETTENYSGLNAL